MTNEELEKQLRFILNQLDEHINALNDYIDELKEDSELADMFKAIGGKTLEEMIDEQNELDLERTEASRRYFSGIKEYMDLKKWQYRSIDETMIIVISFGLTNLVTNVFIILEPITQTVRINTILPVKTNDANEEVLKCMLLDLNYTCRFGSFQHDTETDCLSFYYAYSFLNQDFDAELFEDYLYACLIPPDDYYQIIKEILE